MDEVKAVFFDRDGTLVHDVPYNGNPDRVRPVAGAREAVARLRRAGLKVGVVTNQSGLARGLFSRDEMAAVNARIEELIGPFDTWQVCPHGEDAGCSCRKPEPGLVLAAAAAVGVKPEHCVVVGDVPTDVLAAQAAGATGILVAPAPSTSIRTFASLEDAVGWILDQAAGPRAERVLAVRADAAGDVLLTGPALRALAHGSRELTLLCGPRGRAAAQLLPGPARIVEWALPWIEPAPPALTVDSVAAAIQRLREARFDRAVIFTSFHQSPLPMALLLRLAGVGHISAISEDYPGVLLDIRHHAEPGIPEPERALSLARAAGFELPPGDDGRLRLREPLPAWLDLDGEPYVVVHPGTSVPARACPPPRCAEFTTALRRAGWRVLVTGSGTERNLTAAVAGRAGVDLGGRTSLAELATVLRHAACVVVGNTGPAHLAAAVGTPVVSLFAPTVPFAQWRPYGVPVVRLGDPSAPCKDTRATTCPVPGHPCLARIDPSEVVHAVAELA